MASTVLTCLATSRQLSNASYEKPRFPILPPKDIANEERAKYKVLKRLSVRLTAYYGPMKNQDAYVYGSYRADVRVNGAGKITRSGKKPCIGMAAADWQLLRPGTQFRILDCNVSIGVESLKPASELIFAVEDTGSAVKGLHVDIFCGFGDQGRRLAQKINHLDREKFVIEVIRKC